MLSMRSQTKTKSNTQHLGISTKKKKNTNTNKKGWLIGSKGNLKYLPENGAGDGEHWRLLFSEGFLDKRRRDNVAGIVVGTYNII
jgi:hypothetical protein